jgi:hypothetical protein
VTSHMERTLAYLRENGYECEKVERWQPFFRGRDRENNLIAKGGKRLDLFNAFDVVAISKSNNMVLVQVCADDEAKLRIAKMRLSEGARRVMQRPARDWSVTAQVFAWGKHGKPRKTWQVRRIRVTLDHEYVLLDPVVSTVFDRVWIDEPTDPTKGAGPDTPLADVSGP